MGQLVLPPSCVQYQIQTGRSNEQTNIVSLQLTQTKSSFNRRKNSDSVCDVGNARIKNEKKSIHFATNDKSTKVYSESSQTFKMELFSKIGDGFQPLIIFTKIFIFDNWLGSEYVSHRNKSRALTECPRCSLYVDLYN